MLPSMMDKEPVSNSHKDEDQKILDDMINYLDTIFEDLNQLYVQTQLLLCDMTICFSSPVNAEAVKHCEETYKHPNEISDQHQC
ncbi:synaptonemal complex central element protein 3 isoform X3 [Stegostoma tigrinum]|uniref:synaptonemal complex central element protein 3 isoform X3 n=1 Tax=Stegostoma tigrinum TaxID=3053191 RepID=UPI002870248B|nr:synaptonemal complex central element protein 3 isoform X3 [Stegostoma tigrinum]